MKCMTPNRGRGNPHSRKDLTQLTSTSAMQTNLQLVLNSLHPTNIIGKTSFFLFLNEKWNTKTRTNSGHAKAALTPPLDSVGVLHITALLHPQCPVPFLGCYCQCYHTLTCSIQFSSVAQLSPTLCDPMDCSTQVLPVHHQIPAFT